MSPLQGSFGVLIFFNHKGAKDSQRHKGGHLGDLCAYFEFLVVETGNQKSNIHIPHSTYASFLSAVLRTKEGGRQAQDGFGGQVRIPQSKFPNPNSVLHSRQVVHIQTPQHQSVTLRLKRTDYFIDTDERNFRTIVDSLQRKNPHLEIVFDPKTNSVHDKSDKDFYSEVLETSKAFKGRMITYINRPYYSVILDGEQCDWGTCSS